MILENYLPMKTVSEIGPFPSKLVAKTETIISENELQRKNDTSKAQLHIPPVHDEASIVDMLQIVPEVESIIFMVYNIADPLICSVKTNGSCR